MPRVPLATLGKMPAAKRDEIWRYRPGDDPFGPSKPEPTDFQKAAAKRVAKTYDALRYDSRFMNAMRGKLGGEQDYQLEKLNQAMVLARAVDEANGRAFDKTAAAEHESWLRTLAKPK